MVYVALLRGINVGGNNRVDMKQLKAAFESAGMKSVSTYINSGNVIFSDSVHTKSALTLKLEAVVLSEFGFAVKVLLCDIKSMTAIAKTIPTQWTNDSTMKCDVLFLWESVDSPAVIDQLPLRDRIDTAKYVAGAIVWSVERKNIGQSGMVKIIGTPLYKQVTVRNCNTTRKLLSIMEAIDPAGM